MSMKQFLQCPNKVRVTFLVLGYSIIFLDNSNYRWMPFGAATVAAAFHVTSEKVR